MEFTDQQHQGTCHVTIHRLPDEVLLEIFDSYRQSTYPYDRQWKKNYVWLNLAHVCARWRAVIFSSSSRLDLSVTVGPHKPVHINTVLSSPFPIFVEYNNFTGNPTGSAIWRMRAALRHRDRVREISFGWPTYNNPLTTEQVVSFFKKFITATNFHFPALENLTLRFIYGLEPEFPATFLRGPGQSDLRLRRLRLYDAPLIPLSGLLLSATALTDLTLTSISPDAEAFDLSRGSLLLKCLQGMGCLRSLDITTPHPRVSQPHHSTPTPKDIVPLSKLTRFHFAGPTMLWNNLMSGLSVPSLQDAHIMIGAGFPLLYLSRVIDDVADEFRSIKVTFGIDYFCLFSSIHSAKFDCFEPSFWFTVDCSLNSVQSISSTPSTKLAMAEELALSFITSDMIGLENHFSLRGFLRQFRSVRVLRVDSFIPAVGLYLREVEGGTFPLLEEIEVSVPRLTEDSDEEYEYRAVEVVAAFEPLASARERAGSVLKVSHRELE